MPLKKQPEPGQQGKSGKATPGKPKQDPLSFGASLDALYEGAEQITDAISLTVRDVNQFWFILPDGILPNNPEADVTVPYLRFTAEGRRACMLSRMVFTRNNGVVPDSTTGRKVMLEFRPCLLLSRGREGGASVQRLDDFETPSAPPPPPEPEGTKIPDIGELLEGLHETRKSLDTIDTLLTTPDALLAADDDQRRQLQEDISSTKDKALIGLSQLGDVLARGPEQSLTEWREGVSTALAATIEAMVAFEDLSEHIREEKRRQLETLRQSIESFFATIDPSVDFDACRKFSTGVNQIILSERKDTLQIKRTKLEKNIEKSYDFIISSLQQALSKGSSLPLIPHPATEPADGFETKIILNMIHIVMAVRYGGLSIKLDTERFPRFHTERRGWDTTHPPRIHVVDRRRYQALMAGSHKLQLFQ
jgi:hypothetical protein